MPQCQEFTLLLFLSLLELRRYKKKRKKNCIKLCNNLDKQGKKLTFVVGDFAKLTRESDHGRPPNWSRSRDQRFLVVASQQNSLSSIFMILKTYQSADLGLP